MHDLHLANQIVTLARSYAQKRRMKIIKKLKIVLGNFYEHGAIVTDENLKFNIKLLLGNGADVVIEKKKGEEWELVEVEGE
ncbi:MAG: hypothetical protein V1770_05580 [bacterium]